MRCLSGDSSVFLQRTGVEDLTQGCGSGYAFKASCQDFCKFAVSAKEQRIADASPNASGSVIGDCGVVNAHFCCINLSVVSTFLNSETCWTTRAALQGT